MPSNVSAEEVQAILDLVQPKTRAPAEVATRDFRRPHRLSGTQLDSLATRVRKALPEVEALLRAWLRSPHDVDVAEVRESHAEELVKALVPPMCVLCFDCAGQPSWAAWECAAAVAAAEIALGTHEVAAPVPRTLSSVERGLLKNILARIATIVCASLGTEATNHRLVQEVEALGSWRDAKLAADPQRITLRVGIEGPGITSTLSLHVGGLQIADAAQAASQKAKAKAAKAGLPVHLADVIVEVGAQLGSVELALDALLGLEVGDVILLGVDVGSLLDLYVEGLPCATAHWGDRQGHLALEIAAIGAQIESKHV